MLEGSVFDGKNQCLGTGMTPFLVGMTKKRGTGMTLKE